MLKTWAKRVGGGIVLAAFIIFLGACGTEGLDGPITRPAKASASGQVVSVTTGAVLHDVSVRIGSIIVHTDQWGNFLLHTLTPGTYSLTVEADGYRDHTQTIRLTAGDNDLGQITLLDLPPEPPVL